MASIPSISLLGSPMSRSNSLSGSPRAQSPIPHEPLARTPSLSTKSFQEEQLKHYIKENEDLKAANEELRKQNASLLWQHQEMMLISLNYVNTSDDSRMTLEMKEFREELVRHLETGFMKAFPGSKVTNFIEKLLVEPKMLLVSVIAESIRPDAEQDIDSLCTALVTVFEYSQKTDLLIKWAIHQELNSKKRHNELFRESSVCSQIIRSYFFLKGRDYLISILTPTIEKFCGTKESYEIDPERNPSAEGRKKALKKLKKRTNELISVISKSTDSVPEEIKIVLSLLKTAIKEKFPLVDPNCYLGSFIFLRLICPALVIPSLNGFDVKPTPQSQRGLILMAKILQNVSNNSGFGGKEEFLSQLSDIFEKNQRSVHSFLDSISNLPKTSQFPNDCRILVEEKGKAISTIISFAHKHSGQLDSLFGGDSSTVLGFFSQSLGSSQQPQFRKKYVHSLSLAELIEKAERGAEELLVGPEMWDKLSPRNTVKVKGLLFKEEPEEIPIETSDPVDSSSFHNLLSFWVDRRKKKKANAPLKRCGSSSPRQTKESYNSMIGSGGNSPLRRCGSGSPSPKPSPKMDKVDLKEFLDQSEKQNEFAANRSQSWIQKTRNSIWK